MTAIVNMCIESLCLLLGILVCFTFFLGVSKSSLMESWYYNELCLFPPRSWQDKLTSLPN
jgi:hypothetical protein